MAVIKAVVLFAFSNYNIITFRCPRLYACGRSNFIFVLLHQSPWMSLVYITYRCEVGATERCCSGSIGSDDTRGYGAGSGDVGKELPRGMIP